MFCKINDIIPDEYAPLPVRQATAERLTPWHVLETKGSLFLL